MTTVANQNVATINKEVCNKDNLYTTNNLEALQKAMADLSGAELKVWLYFAKNQNGYKLAVSPADATTWGIPKSSFHKAFTALKDKGYLVETSPNHFDFYEMPKEEQEIIVTINKASNEFTF